MPPHRPRGMVFRLPYCGLALLLLGAVTVTAATSTPSSSPAPSDTQCQPPPEFQRWLAVASLTGTVSTGVASLSAGASLLFGAANCSRGTQPSLHATTGKQVWGVDVGAGTALNLTMRIDTCDARTSMSTSVAAGYGCPTAASLFSCVVADSGGCGNGTGRSVVLLTGLAARYVYLIVEGISPSSGAYVMNVTYPYVPPTTTPTTTVTTSLSATGTSTASRSATLSPTQSATATRSATSTPTGSLSPNAPCALVPGVNASMTGLSNTMNGLFLVLGGRTLWPGPVVCSDGGVLDSTTKVVVSIDLTAAAVMGGALYVDTCVGATLATVDTTLYVGPGCPRTPAQFACAASNNNSCGPRGLQSSTIYYPVLSQYAFVVVQGSAGATGGFALNYTYTPQLPSTTPTPSITPSPSATAPPTKSSAPTPSNTPSPSPSKTSSLTGSPTPTSSPSSTASLSHGVDPSSSPCPRITAVAALAGVAVQAHGYLGAPPNGTSPPYTTAVLPVGALTGWAGACAARGWSNRSQVVTIDLGFWATLGGILYLDTCNASTTVPHVLHVGTGCINCAAVDVPLYAPYSGACVGGTPAAGVRAAVYPLNNRYVYVVIDGTNSSTNNSYVLTADYSAYLPSATATVTASGTHTGTPTSTSTQSSTSTGSPTKTSTASSSRTSSPSSTASLSLGVTPTATPLCGLAVNISASLGGGVAGGTNSGSVSGTLSATSPVLFAGICTYGGSGASALPAGPKNVYMFTLGGPNGTGPFVPGLPLSLDTCGGAADTVIAVGTGCPTSLASFTCIGADDDAPGVCGVGSKAASVVISSVASPLVYVVVGAGASSTPGVGAYTLHYAYPAPTTSATASSTPSSTLSGTRSGTGTSSGTGSRSSTPPPSPTATWTATPTLSTSPVMSPLAADCKMVTNQNTLWNGTLLALTDSVPWSAGNAMWYEPLAVDGPFVVNFTFRIVEPGPGGAADGFTFGEWQ